MIKQCPDGTFVISAAQCWRPGVYESEGACRKAQRLPDESLSSLMSAANARMPEGVNGTITAADIDNFNRERRKP